jgi:hypothetical protein
VVVQPAALSQGDVSLMVQAEVTYFCSIVGRRGTQMVAQ